MNLEIAVPSYKLTYGKKATKAVLRRAGSEIAALARRLIRNSTASGKKRGDHVASAPGEPPASQTGNLVSSLTTRVREQNNAIIVSIRDKAFYSRFLETGAKGGGGNARNTANLRPPKNPGSKRRMKAGAINQARVMEPRPFLSTAFNQKRESIAARIQDAILNDIDFKKQR